MQEWRKRVGRSGLEILVNWVVQDFAFHTYELRAARTMGASPTGDAECECQLHHDFHLVLLTRFVLFFLVCLCSHLNTQFAHQMGQSLTSCKFLSVLSFIFVLQLCNHHLVLVRWQNQSEPSAEVSDGACHELLYPFSFQEHCTLDKEIWNQSNHWRSK